MSTGNKDLDTRINGMQQYFLSEIAQVNQRASGIAAELASVSGQLLESQAALKEAEKKITEFAAKVTHNDNDRPVAALSAH